MKRSRPDRMAAGDFYVGYPGTRTIPVPVAVVAILAAALACVQGPTAHAQSTVSLEGYVYDAISEHAVPQATVRVEGTDYRARTDAFGYFYLENIAAGRYRLTISAAGYRPRRTDLIYIHGDMPAGAEIALERIVYELDDREVRGRRMSPISSTMEVVDRAEIQTSGAVSVGDVLDRMAGVYIQKNGSSGGGTRVRIRGSDPEHVLVLVDGQRVNPSGSGQADLETIPIEMVEKIEVYRGGESARFGPDALGGVINIVTMKSGGLHPEIRTEAYQGKWRTGAYRIILDDPVRARGVSARVAYSFQESDGDFPYRYSVEPSSRTYSGVRQNAESQAQNIFGSVMYRFTERTSVQFSGQAYRSRQGLPGSVSTIDTTAWKRDSRILGTLRLNHAPSRNFDIELEVGRSRFEQYFNNVNHQYRDYRYEDKYTNDLASAALTGRFRYRAGSEVTGGIEFRRDVVRHENLYRPEHSMDRATRDYLGLFLVDRHEFDLDAVPFLRTLAFDYALRRDNIAARRDDPDDDYGRKSGHWSYKSGVSLTHGNRYKLVARASYGKSIRLPSINALFWAGDVRSAPNPDLLPERSEHSDAGIELSVDGDIGLSAGVTYFHSHVSDLIVWQPGYKQVWKPVNLEAAIISGHEDVVQISVHDDLFTFAYRNTITVARNRSGDVNVDGAYLVFRPHYVTDLEWSSAYKVLRASYRVRLVDVRYSTAANTRWYDSYRTDDASVSATFDISTITATIGYRVSNVLDERYELIGQYPMPGREWGLDISLNYRL